MIQKDSVSFQRDNQLLANQKRISKPQNACIHGAFVIWICS